MWHEYVPGIDPDEAFRSLGQHEAEPDAVVHDGEMLSAPDLNEASAQPPMRAEPGDGRGGASPGRRSPEFRPDRLTELEQTLDYYASFNPSIAPFKRVTSLNTIVLAADGVTPVLTVSDQSRTQVPISPPDVAPPDDRPRDRFWGQVDLDLSAGRTVPLPSVSPESRILSLRSQPSVEARIVRDGADNYFVRVDGPPRMGAVRLAFLTDAPKSYFGMPIPALPVGTQHALVPPVPPSVKRRGLLFARELGLSRKSDLRTALHRLVAHFRAFEASAEPPEGDDIFLALARGKKGICRHRAYAFVVAAQALGIPARFVQNEAHSWVEVRVADLGFLRIDLGGAANGMRAHETASRTRYRPDRPDELPRPEAYERSYSQAAPAAFADSGATGRATQADVGRWLPPAATGDPAPGAGVHPAAAPLGASRPVADPRTPLRVLVEQRRAQVVRGETMMLSGRVALDDGTGAPAMRVEVSLASKTRTERMLLGVVVTDGRGRFRTRLTLPPDLAVGDYELVVLTPGDARHLPAIAD